MPNAQLITEIKKLRVNAFYGKKRHYNASERKRHAHQALTYTVLVLNILTGSMLFGIMKEHLWEHLPALSALVSALLIGTSEFFKFSKSATEHQAIGDRYLGLGRQCSGVVALGADGHIEGADLKHRYLELQSALTEIDVSASAHPTSRKDYGEVRKGVADGEERYTAQELNEAD